jgi:glycosyltransferase involved in cell wall biosynthesis
MKSLLVITHDTSLSGAPKSLLLSLEELSKRDISITVVAIKGGGVLESRFKACSRKYYRLDILSKAIDYSIKSRIRFLLFRKPFSSEYTTLISSIASQYFDYIYANTVVSLSLGIEFSKKSSTKLILHVHELSTVIQEFCPQLYNYVSEITLFIVPSLLNKKCLIDEYLIPEHKIEVIREASDFFFNGVKHSHATINILMSGGAYWRKGDDLFIQIAKRLVSFNPLFRFYWVGYSSEERKRVNNSDVCKLGLTNHVFFVDETTNPETWYANSDLFLLSSREDPFPLVAIEAGMLGLPIVCFDKATGIAEVIDSSCVVPYLDIESMCSTICAITSNSDLMIRLGNENKKTFSTFTGCYIADNIQTILAKIP